MLLLIFYFPREGRGKKCSVRTTISQNIPLVVLGFLRLAMVTLSGMSRVMKFIFPFFLLEAEIIVIHYEEYCEP